MTTKLDVLDAGGTFVVLEVVNDCELVGSGKSVSGGGGGVDCELVGSGKSVSGGGGGVDCELVGSGKSVSGGGGGGVEVESGGGLVLVELGQVVVVVVSETVTVVVVVSETATVVEEHDEDESGGGRVLVVVVDVSEMVTVVEEHDGVDLVREVVLQVLFSLWLCVVLDEAVLSELELVVEAEAEVELELGLVDVEVEQPVAGAMVHDVEHPTPLHFSWHGNDLYAVAGLSGHPHCCVAVLRTRHRGTTQVPQRSLVAVTVGQPVCKVVVGWVAAAGAMIAMPTMARAPSRRMATRCFR